MSDRSYKTTRATNGRRSRRRSTPSSTTGCSFRPIFRSRRAACCRPCWRSAQRNGRLWQRCWSTHGCNQGKAAGREKQQKKEAKALCAQGFIYVTRNPLFCFTTPSNSLELDARFQQFPFLICFAQRMPVLSSDLFTNFTYPRCTSSPKQIELEAPSFFFSSKKYVAW